MEQRAIFSDTENKKLERSVQDDETKRRIKEIQDYRGEK
jgi:hypothetical protein